MSRSEFSFFVSEVTYVILSFFFFFFFVLISFSNDFLRLFRVISKFVSNKVGIKKSGLFVVLKVSFAKKITTSTF